MNHRILTLETSYLDGVLSPSELGSCAADATEAYRRLQSKTCPGANFLGWMDLPETMATLVPDIQRSADEIRRRDPVHVVVGIGGSHLGARCVIEALRPTFVPQPRAMEIVFAGHHLSASHAEELLAWLEKRDFSVNLVSRSGTTTEPAVLFRLIKPILEKRYGRSAGMQRMIVTTDERKGPLRDLANQFGLKTYPVPDDVGGRYPVLSAAGLLPVAVAGIDIQELVAGARDSRTRCLASRFEENPVLQYAAARHLLGRKGKQIEVFASFHPHLHCLIEWLKQLFGEPEGKRGKHVFAAGCDHASGLHSIGQYAQEETRSFFETFIVVDRIGTDLSVPTDPQDADGLNYLAHRPLEEVNRMAFEGTRIAHADGGVPSIAWRLPELDAYHLGAMLYAFETACAVSGLLDGINPLDQPGLDACRTNMFALLGKPGFETRTATLQRRVSSASRSVSL